MDCPLTRFSSANRRRILAIPRPIEPTSRFQPTHSRDSPAHEITARRRTVAPNSSASGEESGRDQPGGAPRLGAGAEGEVARLRRHGGRHRAAAAAVSRRRRWGRRGRGGVTTSESRRRGIGFIWGGKLAVGRSAMTRKKGRRGAGGREERRGPRKR